MITRRNLFKSGVAAAAACLCPWLPKPKAQSSESFMAGHFDEMGKLHLITWPTAEYRPAKSIAFCDKAEIVPLVKQVHRDGTVKWIMP